MKRVSGRGLAHVAALVGYALLTVVMTWPLATQVTTAIPGDSFDGWQNYWNLWWVKVALVDRLQNPYVTDLLYYPTGVGLYFHTLNPFNGLATLPVQLAVGLIPAYNAVVWLSWVLAGYGVFLLALWMLPHPNPPQVGEGIPHPGPPQVGEGIPHPSPPQVGEGIPHPGPPQIGEGRRYAAAFVAGLIFTFAPVHMAHLLGHMQVMALQWLPFYALALLRGVSAAQAGRPWVRAGLLAGLYLIFAGLCDWYFVLYLLLFTGLVVVWAWARGVQTRRAEISAQPTGPRPAAAWRRWAGPVAAPLVAGALFAVVLAPLLAPMVLEALRFSFMVRPSSDLYILSASLSDFLIPNRLHTLFRPDSFAWPGNQIAPVSERTIALGYGALALALLGAWRGRVPGRRLWLWGAAVLFFVLMAMGPRLHVGNIDWAQIPGGIDSIRGVDVGDPGQEWSPYALVNTLVPFMRISRSVSRFAIMVQLSVAVLAGVGLLWLLARLRRGWWAAAAAAALLVLAEYWVVPYPLSPPDTPAYYHALAADADSGAVLNLPMNYDRPGYLLYQTVHQRPLTVAYISRDDPRTLTERVPLLQHLRHLGPDILADDPARVGQTVLRDLGVAWVVLDRYKMPGGAEREVTTALAEAAFAGHAPTYEDERITVYAVPPDGAVQAYLGLGPLEWGPLRHDGTARYRTLGTGPAELTVYHAAPGRDVAITYRTADGAALAITVDGATTRHAAASTSTKVTVTPGADGRIILQADGRVDILEVALSPAP